MLPDIPWYITAIILTTDAAIAASVWWILFRAAARSGLPATTQRSVRLGIALFLAVWFGAALLLAPDLASLPGRDPFAIAPAVPFFSVVPLALIGLALTLSPALRRVLASAPVPALIGVQAYRVIGAIFLVLYAQGQMPAHFALPAGWGDVAVGLAAPLVALALARGMPGARALALSWVVFGLLDLAVAVGMGTGLLAPYLMPALGPRVPPVGAMGAFPLILVPSLAVPISVALHLTALVRLVGPAAGTREVAPGSLGAS